MSEGPDNRYEAAPRETPAGTQYLDAGYSAKWRHSSLPPPAAPYAAIGNQAAQQRRGAADRGEYRHGAGLALITRFEMNTGFVRRR